MSVYADPSVLTFDNRPALFQEFERPLVDRFGRTHDRVGVFLYRLLDASGAESEIWTYDYVQYGEKYVGA